MGAIADVTDTSSKRREWTQLKSIIASGILKLILLRRIVAVEAHRRVCSFCRRALRRDAVGFHHHFDRIIDPVSRVTDCC